MNTTTEKRARRTRRSYSAGEKAAAVLAVWSGHRRTARVCRELSITWSILHSWEQRGLLGMRRALGDLPGEQTPTRGGGELGKRLETLLGAAVTPPALEPLAPAESQV